MIAANAARTSTLGYASTPGQAPRPTVVRDEPAPTPGSNAALAQRIVALHDELEADLPATTEGLTQAPTPIILPTGEAARAELDAATLAAKVGNDPSSAPLASTSTATTAAPSASTHVVNLRGANGGPANVNARVQWVMRDAYLEVTQDLYLYAEKVRFFNDVKQAIRGELERANGALAATAGQEDDARLNPPFQTQAIDTDFYGQPFVPPPPIATEAAAAPELPPLFQAVLDGMRALLPVIINDQITKKFPAAGPIADVVVDTVLKLLDGVEAGTLNLQTAVLTVAEGIYDLLPTVLPELIKHYFPGAGNVAGLPEQITQLIMGFLPDPGAALEDDDATTLDTKAELEAHIKKLEEELSSVGDDAQLANVDLQNHLQKQQQLMQMLSNVAKMLHDTALAVIRKID